MISYIILYLLALSGKTAAIRRPVSVFFYNRKRSVFIRYLLVDARGPDKLATVFKKPEIKMLRERERGKEKLVSEMV